MKPIRPALFILCMLCLAPAPVNAMPAPSPAPVVELNRIEAQQTCHHVRQTSRRHCTSRRLLQQAIRPPLYYPRAYYGTRHYSNPFQYYGYRPFYSPYNYYSPYWNRGPFWP
jgi:hypothetical protein